MKYLKEILISKKEEIKNISRNQKREGSVLDGSGEAKRSFLKKIQKGKINIIAEIKKASPSRGIINSRLDIEKTAVVYDKFKDFICGISVLTEPLYFKGEPENIKIVKQNSKLPVLRKDFIFSEMQVYQSAVLGADCILLISSILGKKKLKRLFSSATGLDLEVLVEVHRLEELDKALDIGAQFIGINNRNLGDMSVDSRTTFRLLNYVHKRDLQDKIFVCESGVEDIEYIKKLFFGGINTFLIGGYFMASKNLEETLNNMKTELKREKLL